jgi:prophage antirepressor-like protein
MSKKSIRFYKDHKVRAVWDDEQNLWWFSVLDIVGLFQRECHRFQALERLARGRE